MCIRDSVEDDDEGGLLGVVEPRRGDRAKGRSQDDERRHVLDAQGEGDAKEDPRRCVGHVATCLLYTSDAADERSSVDLGGRRIIKKKKQEEHKGARGALEREDSRHKRQSGDKHEKESLYVNE